MRGIVRHQMWLACVAWALCATWVSLYAQAPPTTSRVTERPPSVGLFAHSEDCQACHNNLTSASGEDLSIGTAWRSTMMANSARDPYWQAAVRREATDHPMHSAEIQDECGGCHMPMSTHTARAAGAKGEVFSHLPIAGDDGDAIDRFAADGVSCTVCHQVSPDGLGTRERFNGQFAVTPPLPSGVRRIYGPFDIDPGRKTIMRSVTGYEQVQAPHIKESELCAACHTLITQAIGPSGEVIGSLPEQMNYQEWQHSAFVQEKKSCQSCHMPAVKGPVRVASVLGDGRESLSRHAFVGGNAHMLGILNRYRTDLGVAASAQELQATAAATVRQLQQDTATLALSPPQVVGGALRFDLDVHNLTGHKFPTGYPSRRTWLHVTVTDDRGGRVFESGAIDDAGAIAGNDADVDAARFEPHHETISSGDQVQIYEPILGDRNGVPTTGLLTATQYLKDNRLLPRGFDKTTADPQIGVYGSARNDGDFASAGDRVRYDVRVPEGRAFVVDVELRYQSIGYRWAHNLERYAAAEPRRFVSYYNATAAGSSVLVAHATARVDRR